MTTSTTAEVGHGGKERTVVEIDGFRGRLIGADHADSDIARYDPDSVCHHSKMCLAKPAPGSVDCVSRLPNKIQDLVWIVDDCRPQVIPNPPR